MSRGQQGIGIRRRRHVRRADDRQAGEDHLARSRQEARPTITKSRSTPRRNKPKILNGKRRRRRHRRPAPRRREVTSTSTASSGSDSRRLEHGTRSRSNSKRSTTAAAAASTSTCEQTAIANPHVRLHYNDPENNERLFAARRRRCRPEAEGNQAASVRDRTGPLDRDALRTRRIDRQRVFCRAAFRASARARRGKLCEHRENSARG